MSVIAERWKEKRGGAVGKKSLKTKKTREAEVKTEQENNRTIIFKA